MQQRLSAAVEQGEVLRGGSDQGGEERLGLVVLAVAAVKAGELTCDRRAVRLGGVEFFEDGDGLGELVLRRVEVGELGAERDVVGGLGESLGQQSLGLIGLLLADQQVDEACGGIGRARLGGEQAAIGGFGSGEIAGGLGKLGGEEDVVRGLGGELERGEQVRAGCGRIAGKLVEPGERTPGAGLQSRVGSVERGCGGQSAWASLGWPLRASSSPSERCGSKKVASAAEARR